MSILDIVKQYEQLFKDAKTAEEFIEKYEAMKQKLNDEIASLEKKLAGLEQEADCIIVNARDETDRIKADMEKVFQQERDRIAAKDKELFERESNVLQMTNDAKQAKVLAADILTEANIKLDVAVNLQSETGILANKVGAERADISELASRLKTQASELNALKAAIDTQAKGNEEANKNIQAQLQEIAKERAKNQDLIIELEDRKKQLDEYKLSLDKYQSELNAKQKELEDKEKVLSQKERNLNDKEVNLNNLQQEVAFGLAKLKNEKK